MIWIYAKNPKRRHMHHLAIQKIGKLFAQNVFWKRNMFLSQYVTIWCRLAVTDWTMYQWQYMDRNKSATKIYVGHNIYKLSQSFCASLPTYKEQGKDNGKLIYCLSQYIFHHCPRNEWFCTSVWLPQQEIRCGQFSCQSQRSQSVHNQVHP